MPRSLALILASLFGACSPGEPGLEVTAAEAERNPGKVVVARVAEQRYTLADIVEAISRRGPLAQERYQAPQAKLAFLENFVDFEVLSREAMRLGLHRTPEATRALKAALAQALVDRGQLPGADRAALTEERLRATHARHREAFLEPEKVRVAHILVKLPEGKPLESRRRARFRAAEVLRELGPAPDAERFAKLARRRSDDEATRERGGDLGLLARGVESDEVPEEVVAAAFRLRPGEISGLVESPAGVHILRVAARYPARPASFAAVRKQVEARLWSEMRREALRRLIDALTAAARVEVDAKVARELGERSRWLPGK
jgi:parvulin-like peptidyl-prolyl isomerase